MLMITVRRFGILIKACVRYVKAMLVWGNWSHHLVMFFGIPFSVGNFRQGHNRELWTESSSYKHVWMA